jgi:hypothetical protein
VSQAPAGRLAAIVHIADDRGAQLARFVAATGALDPGFGAGGTVPLGAFPQSAGPVVTAAGDIVVALSDTGLSQRVLVRRYLG